MISFRQLWRQCRRINEKTVLGDDTIYYKAGTDTACSTTIDGVRLHFFDGSNTFREWFKNFVAFRVGLYGSAIGYDSTAKDLFDQMRGDISSTDKNVFIGFSRGGAIALLVMVRVINSMWRRGLKPNCDLLTYEAPKAGGRKLRRECRRLAFNHTRITMNGDIVPTLVPYWRGHYETTRIKLKNKEFGIRNKHTRVEKYLPDGGIC